MQEYFHPFFLSGAKKYIERGDVIKVEDVEFFVLNSFPDNGFISKDTIAVFKFGLNKEMCYEKLHAADNKYAANLQQNEEMELRELNCLRSSSYGSLRDNLRNFSPIRMRSLDEVLTRSLFISNRTNCNISNLTI